MPSRDDETESNSSCHAHANRDVISHSTILAAAGSRRRRPSSAGCGARCRRGDGISRTIWLDCELGGSVDLQDMFIEHIMIHKTSGECKRTLVVLVMSVSSMVQVSEGVREDSCALTVKEQS